MPKVYTEHIGSIVFADHTTPWLTLRNIVQKDDCEHVRVDQTSIFVFTIMQILATLLYFTSRYFPMIYFPSTFAFVSFVFTMLNPVLLGWMIIALRLHKRRCKIRKLWFAQLIIWLDSFYVVGTCIAFSLIIITIGYNGSCSSPGRFQDGWCFVY